MKKLLILILVVNSAFASSQEIALPDNLPFKRSLIITSTLLLNSPQNDPEKVAELSSKIADYAVLEAKAKSVVEPLRAARKTLKDAAQKITFKDIDDLKAVTLQLQKDTDELVSHNLIELHRDNLTQFDESTLPVLHSKEFAQLLEAGEKYRDLQTELQKHPLFEDIEKTRRELKRLMNSYLHENYASLQELHKAFNDAAQSVNIYLEAALRE